MDTLTPTTPPAASVPAKTPPPAPADLPIEWVAPSHHNHERTPRWYAIFAAVILGISAYAILAGAWSVALVTILLGGVYYLVRREPTPLKYIRIEKDGFQFQDTFTPWKQCKDFWLVQTPLFTELHIRKLSGVLPEVIIQTGTIDTPALRAAISQNLAMKTDQQERALDAIIRICKL